MSGLRVAHLFAEGRASVTVLLWVVFFMSLLDLYLLSNWLPTVLNDLGVSVSGAAAIGAMLQVGGVVGTFTLGQFIDRFSFRALSLTYLGAAVAVAAVGMASHSIVLVLIARQRRDASALSQRRFDGGAVDMPLAHHHQPARLAAGGEIGLDPPPTAPTTAGSGPAVDPAAPPLIRGTPGTCMARATGTAAERARRSRPSTPRR